MVRPVPAGRRGRCCTPYSRLQEEIDNVETIAVTANNTANNASQLALQAMERNTFDDITVDGDLSVYGDIIQQGSSYETHAEQVFTTKDYILMREGALAALGAGEYSGFQVKKYDGTNDGRLVIDRNGTARVGDVGDEQPLLTRDESSDMVNSAPLIWDAANSKAICGSFPADDPGVATINGISPDADNDFTIEAGENVTITQGTNKITIGASGGGGGEWTLRTPNSDWNDLFEINASSQLVAKKTIWVTMRLYNASAIIPKGETAESSGTGFQLLKLSGIDGSPSTPQIIIEDSAFLKNTQLTSTSFTVNRKTLTISSASVQTVNDTHNVNKSNLIIYTLE